MNKEGRETDMISSSEHNSYLVEIERAFRAAPNRVYQINTPDDYSEYLADKGLAQAYKQRAEMDETHNFQALARKWLEHERAEAVITPPNSKENSDDHS